MANLLFIYNQIEEKIGNTTENQIGQTEYRQIGPKLCGRTLPSTITSQTEKIRITFRTNENINGDGFKVRKASYHYNQALGSIFRLEA